MSNLLASWLNDCRILMQSGLPQPCLLCGARTTAGLLCPGCVADMPALPRQRCRQCALPSPGGEWCGHCLKRPPSFRQTVAAHAYAFPLDALVRHYKYGGKLALADWFAERLARELDGAPLPDLILPMPLHDARLARRGFNQAAEIARRLAPRLGLPWLADGCLRQRDTPPQAGLDLKARRRNLRGAFVCELDLRGKRVALVDDVMTSGASLDELGRCVLAAGAAEVCAWVAARTL